MIKKSRCLTIVLCLALIHILPAFPAYASDASNPILAQAPAIFPNGGNYLGAASVTITSTYGDAYYTTDGSNPANSRTAIAYSGKFTLNRSGLLIAASRGPSGWSSAASAMFNIGGPFPRETGVTGAPEQAVPLKLAALYNKSGQAEVAVAYNSDPDMNAGYTVTISNKDTGNVIGSAEITADNTGVVIGPVEEGPAYELSVRQPKSKKDQYYGTFSIKKNTLDKEQLDIDQKLFYAGEDGASKAVAVPAGSDSSAKAVTYSGYHSDGSPIFSGYTSLYRAIDAVSTWENGAYVLESDGNSRVFMTKNSPPIYHMYQRTVYYGSTTSLTAATSWIDTIPYTHVIDGNGKFVMNSYNSTSPPDRWALEPQSGGYAYKFSYVSSTYRAVYTTLDFTQAKLRKSTDRSRAYNAYVYLATQNQSGTAEGGIVCLDYGSGNWYLFYKRSDTSLPTITSNIVCGSTQSGNNFTPNADLEMVFSYTDGSFMINVRNLKTNAVYSSGVVTDEGVGGSSVLISAVSYVPVTQNFTNTPNYQAGGHFKNVRYTKSYLSYVNGGTRDFSASSSSVHYALGYNDDYCTYTREDLWEEISIAYDGQKS